MAGYGPQWNALSQVQPNVSGLLGVAQDGINKAGDAAASILERYDTGQRTKGDQELVRLMASATNQEELSALVNSDAVRGLRLSQDGISMLNEAQGNRVDWMDTRGRLVNDTNNTNSIIGDRTGRLGLAQNADNRLQTEFDRGTVSYNENRDRQQWMRDNAGNFIQSELNGLNNGSAFSRAIDRTESGGATDQYDTLYGHRNRQDGTRVSEMTLGQAVEFASPNGAYGQSVNAEIGRVATPMGKFQIVGTTLRNTMENLNLSPDVPFSPAVQEQLGLYLAQQRVSGSQTAQNMRDGLRAEWEGFRNKSDAELDGIIAEVRAQPPVTRESILAAGSGSPTQAPQTGATPQGQGATPLQDNGRGFGGDAFAQSMAASGLFTPEQILGTVSPLRDAATEGNARNVTEREGLQADIMSASLDRQLNSPDNLTGTDLVDAVRKELLASNQFSETEASAAARRAETLLAESEAYQNQLKPTVAEDLARNAAVENTITDERRRYAGQDQNRALGDISRYQEDPSSNLATDLDLAHSTTNFDPEELRGMVNQLANHYNVEPAVMAVAMRDSFVRDPAWIRGENNWTGLGWDLTRNTLANQFDETSIEAKIAQLTPDARRAFDRGNSNLNIMEGDMQRVRTQQRQVEARMAKLDANDPRRASFEAQLLALDGQLASIRNERTNDTSR